ncbi:MAG TPA: hypothetical protein VHK01_16665 [Lacipirellulaceae bacterium]|nr:hypothetical protein [Lacipirellulaceae bacterium]
MIKGSATESQATPGEHRPSPGFFFWFPIFRPDFHAFIGAQPPIFQGLLGVGHGGALL